MPALATLMALIHAQIPVECPPRYAALMAACWDSSPTRPTFDACLQELERILAETPTCEAFNS